MRLSPVWVAIAAIASWRQVMLTQIPAAYAAPINLPTHETGKTSTRSQWQVASGGRLGDINTFPSTSPALSSLPKRSQRQALVETLKAQQKPVLSALATTKDKLALNNTQTGVEQLISLPKSQLVSQQEQETPNQIPLTPGTPSPGSDTAPVPDRVQPNQSPPSTPTQTPTVPIIPAPGTQSTPQQETPNRIQVPINGDGQPAPGSFPNQPNQPIPPSPPATEQTQPPEEIQPSPPATPAPEQTQPDTTPEAAEPRVLVAEVAVSSETGELPQELQNAVYQAIQTQPGRITTRSQLQEDINAVFATGFFSNVRAIPEDTPLGVRVSFVVQPNPVLRDVQVQANPGTNVPSVLPPKVVNDIFREQYGSILNLRRFQEGVKQLNQWYQKNGYVLAQVVEAPQVAPNGTVTLQVAEGVVEDIQVRFLQEGEANNDEGQPIKGRTRNFIVTRELALKPGNVFNRNVVQQDLQRVYGLGLFEDVNVSLNPGQDPRKVVVVVNVDERQSGSIGLSGGISSASGLFGAVSFQQQNLGGNNQNLGTELQVGEREVLFDVRFTDPWIAGDPYRTSYTVNGFRRRSISLIFDGEDENIEVGDEDDPSRPRVLRLGGGVNFTRPLSRDPLRRSEWTASTGLQYQRVSIRDNDGEISPIGRIGDKEIPLSFSGDGTDDLLTLQLGAARDLRNNLLTPTTGSFLRFGLEQSVPIGDGNILLSRLRGSYSQYIPVNFTNFNEGPETLAFNVQAGTVIGDLPPYEAFSLGGSNSVRGYDEGDLGSGRSFVQATAEYRFPIFAIVGGALFFDVGSDLGTGKNVPGDPAGLLGKPGTGIGYGVGVRVNSPLGPLRLDYGFNEDGDSRLNFGIGEKF
jgi:outer membrane protein insertion porin family